MYLAERLVVDGVAHEMVGALPVTVEQTGRPQGHGYVAARFDGAVRSLPRAQHCAATGSCSKVSAGRRRATVLASSAASRRRRRGSCVAAACELLSRSPGRSRLAGALVAAARGVGR
jgi:cobyrinic acid a,c-diamide synthase